MSFWGPKGRQNLLTMKLFSEDSGQAGMTLTEEKRGRSIEIDLLRGISILAMMLIHTTVYYLSDPIAAFLWDNSQFAVTAFIFCSGFLYFKRNLARHSEDRRDARILSKKSRFRSSLACRQAGWNDRVNLFKTRIFRLLMPYYLFLPFFFLVLFIVQKKTLTMSYLLRSVFLTGGVDINWLVLLFIEFIVVMPFITWTWQKKKWLFWIYSACAASSSIIFMFYHLPFSWKLIMWLPWSVVLLFVFFFFVFLNKVKDPLKICKDFSVKDIIVLLLFLFSSVIYILSRFVEFRIGHTLTHFANKYPPTIYNISYSLAVISGFYLILKILPGLVEGNRILNVMKSFIIFLSKNSYSIYFIHYCLLILLADVYTTHRIYWGFFFLTVLVLSSVIQFCMHALYHFKYFATQKFRQIVP